MKMIGKTLATLGVLLAAGAALQAQPPLAQPVTPQPPNPSRVEVAPPPTHHSIAIPAMRADPADVASIDAIMAATYDVISGPAGQRRDWERMRSLFVSGARMMPLGRTGLRVGTVEDYIATSGPVLEQRGFFEREIGRVTEQYGDIAHVFSAYEARSTRDGPVMMRGINSFQLVRMDNRWWVATIMWQPETPESPIPERYLNRTQP